MYQLHPWYNWLTEERKYRVAEGPIAGSRASHHPPLRMQATEQGTLKFSIALTVVLGVLGVASGLVTNSQAIIFDGMYSFVDVVPTVVSLLVVKLIARGTTHRFQYGFWHLEPLVAVLRDAILAVACVYASIDALNTLTAGGHPVEYGRAAAWAGVLCLIGLAMTLLLSRRARAL